MTSNERPRAATPPRSIRISWCPVCNRYEYGSISSRKKMHYTHGKKCTGMFEVITYVPQADAIL